MQEACVFAYFFRLSRLEKLNNNPGKLAEKGKISSVIGLFLTGFSSSTQKYKGYYGNIPFFTFFDCLLQFSN